MANAVGIWFSATLIYGCGLPAQGALKPSSGRIAVPDNRIRLAIPTLSWEDC